MRSSTVCPTLGKWSVWFVSVVFIALAFSGEAFSAAKASGGYRLGSGDKIKLTVFGQKSMSGVFSVAGDGSLSLPFVGTIRAGGLTVHELERQIVNQLRPDYLKNPRVSVEVLNFRPFDIIGEVQKPGSYPFRDGMTVINAIAMAGGFTYRAKENEFRIKRAGNGRLEKAARDTIVRPGDVIEVLERFF